MSSFVLIGPGRAGMSLALAAQRAGHEAVGVLGRSNVDDRAARLSCPTLDWNAPLPGSDYTVVAVRDDAIAEVAQTIQPPSHGIAFHLSGMTSVRALTPLTLAGAQIAAFHPLQSLPDPERGVDALVGAAIAVTAGDATVFEKLETFARSIGASPFRLADEQKPLYHAAATVASNYVVTVLALSHELFSHAGVDPLVSRRLTEAVVDHVFAVGPRAALTGPIARGDVGTVAAQRGAVARISDEMERRFVALGEMTAALAGTTDVMAGALGNRPLG